MALRDLTTAPPIAPPRFSLLGTVEVVDDPGLRWSGGYAYVSEVLGQSQHGVTSLDLAACFAPDANELPDTTPYAVGGRQVWADPVVLWAGDQCSTMQAAWRRDAEAKVRRKLLAHQSHDLAAYLWNDGIGQARLGDTATHVGDDAAGLPPQYALACLEEALHDSLRGVQPVIHMGPGPLTLLASMGAVRLDGTRYTTAMGSLVVADAGYSYGGVTPTWDPHWMVGTGPVRARLGPIETQPGEAGAWPEVVAARVNTARVLAWRAATVEVDRYAHVAVRVDMAC